jgi:hypothetical protein
MTDRQKHLPFFDNNPKEFNKAAAIQANYETA